MSKNQDSISRMKPGLVQGADVNMFHEFNNGLLTGEQPHPNGLQDTSGFGNLSKLV